ncbi:MAG TPA: hypothetical protein VF604_14395 [Pyrinomonadaceae bacterium]|jgi:hypothetical protein
MPLKQFDAPGFANDLDSDLKAGWSKKINNWIERERKNLPAPYNKFFFNELQHPETENGSVASITWEGFPRYWILRFPNDEQQRWEASEKLYTSQGETFRYQDEYLEWRGVKKNGKLDKVVFTCEGPEYWEFIADADEQLLLSLYRKYVSPAVQLNDLFTGTGTNRQYNRSNKWNTTDGIAHLTHPANTLGAEINLAARASVLRKKGNVDPVTDTHDLVCCSGFGVESRFSDPTIGAAVNSFVRQGFSVTLNNPIGLYIRKLDTSGIEVPEGYQIRDFWKVIRGDKDKGMILRAEFGVPDGADFSLEDVIVGGNPLKLGAQLAELVEMVIYGKAFKLENALPASVTCENFCDSLNALKASGNFEFVSAIINSNKSNSYIGLRMTAPEAEEVK